MTLIIVILLALTFPINAFSADEFNITQVTKYQIDLSGKALVSQQTDIVNNFSQIYPKEYEVSLSSSNITNIISTDLGGNIVKNIDQQNDTTKISLVFNEPNIGKNQITKFNLNYSLSNLASQKGTTWEIVLPENQTNHHIQKSDIYITVPATFGNISFTSVPPHHVVALNNQTEIYFQDVKKQKILITFGDYQLFDFKFKYFLHNSTNKTDIFTIVLPPETDSQKIIYRSIEPQPLNITIDADGNYLAGYQLTTGQEIDISVNGQAKILHSNLNRATISTNDYLKSNIYWETNDPALIDVATKLQTPKDIYHYVINHLNYQTTDIDTSLRQGASQSLTNPNSSLCTEFTDLFITLARIKGIPAREVQGFAYSNNIKIKPINLNTDILHAWPQYYDHNKQAWISIDPTWGKTTNGIDYFNDLDPNHFAFVFHGLNSRQPLPPGAYKNNHDTKTVIVEFAKEELSTNQIPLKINSSSKFYQPLQLTITNPNYHSISNLTLAIKQLDINQTISVIPPLSSVNINLTNIPYFKSILPQNYILKVNLKHDSGTADFKINNHQYWFHLIILIAATATLIGFVGIILKSHQTKK